MILKKNMEGDLLVFPFCLLKLVKDLFLYNIHIYLNF